MSFLAPKIDGVTQLIGCKSSLRFTRYSVSLRSHFLIDSLSPWKQRAADLTDGWTKPAAVLPFTFFFLSSMIFFPVISCRRPPDLFFLLLSDFLSSPFVPMVSLLQKCIGHMVELHHRSLSRVPYGATVTLHKVFKVITVKQICVYRGRSSLDSESLPRLSLSIKSKTTTFCH